MYELVAIVLVVGIGGIIKFFFNRRRAQRPIETQVEAETDLTPALWWAQGIFDILEASKASPRTFELEGGDLLILSTKGNWRLDMREKRVELLIPKVPRPSEPPEGY